MPSLPVAFVAGPEHRIVQQSKGSVRSVGTQLGVRAVDIMAGFGVPSCDQERILALLDCVRLCGECARIRLDFAGRHGWLSAVPQRGGMLVAFTADEEEVTVHPADGVPEQEQKVWGLVHRALRAAVPAFLLLPASLERLLTL